MRVSTLTPVDAWAFDLEAARRALLDQLKAGGLEGFGLDRKPSAVSAAGALVHYLRSTQKADLAHVRAIAYRQRADAMLIDPTTLKHLEIVAGFRRRTRRVAARRAGSHRHVDGQPAAPLVAAASAAVPRRHSRPARRGGGPRVQDHRTRQVPGCGEGRAGSRTPRGARGHGHRRAARSGRAQAVHRADSTAAYAARRPAGTPAPLSDLGAGRSLRRPRPDRHSPGGRPSSARARRRVHARRAR